MAGHSKWANIKHRKARQDARRGTMWSKCARAIIVAAKNGGGDPAINLSLRYAVEDAKAVNMPKDTIQNAIKKGTGELGPVNYDSMMYEGYGVGGVAVMLEILTDNRNRTAPTIKRIFEKHGGRLGTNGCVSYIFHSKGQVFVPKQAADEETVLAAVLDAGAEDVVDQGDSWQVICEATDLAPVRQAIEDAQLPIESAGITMIPDTCVTCTGKATKRILGMLEELEEHEDVQKVYANFDIPDQELASLEG